MLMSLLFQPGMQDAASLMESCWIILHIFLTCTVFTYVPAISLMSFSHITFGCDLLFQCCWVPNGQPHHSFCFMFKKYLARFGGPVSELKNYSLLTLTLPAHFGYCVFVAVGSILVIEWKSFRVEDARRKQNIPHPVPYPVEDEFNYSYTTYQRMMERYPQFLTLLLLGGLDSPIVSAVGGTIWIIEKVASGFLYESSESKQLLCSAFGFVGWLGLFYSTAKLALGLLQVI